MLIVIIIGVLTTLAGFAGLMACIQKARRIKAEKPEADEVKKRLRGIVVLNMASLAVAMFGLIIVVMGLILK